MKTHILAVLIVGSAQGQNAAPALSQGEIKELTNSLLAAFDDAEKGLLITKAGRYDTVDRRAFVEVTQVGATRIRVVIGAVGKEAFAPGQVIDVTSEHTWKEPFTVVPNRWAFWLSDGRVYFFNGAEERRSFDRILNRFREVGGPCAYPLAFARAPKPLKEWIEKGPNQSPEPTVMSVTPPAAQEPRQP